MFFIIKEILVRYLSYDKIAGVSIHAVKSSLEWSASSGHVKNILVDKLVRFCLYSDKEMRSSNRSIIKFCITSCAEIPLCFALFLTNAFNCMGFLVIIKALPCIVVFWVLHSSVRHMRVAYSYFFHWTRCKLSLHCLQSLSHRNLCLLQYRKGFALCHKPLLCF